MGCNEKKVKRVGLRKLDDPDLQHIKIKPHKEDDNNIFKPEIQRDIESEVLPKNIIVVPDEQVDPYPIIRRTSRS